jgi:hypothetical protein
MTPQLSQQELAALIEREGSPWEFRHRSWNTWLKGIPSENPKWLIAHGYEIRITPDALNEWNLPHGTEPHNPDGLTPEQITEGGMWRATAEGEYLPKGSQVWNPYEGWINTGFVGHYAGGSALRRLAFRVPITTPLPAVKESLTPQPATGQSKTPRTDATVTGNSYPCSDEYEDLAIFARTLETELNAAMAERQDFLDTLTAIYAKLDIKDGDVPGTEKVSDTVQRYVTAALAERDEARRLLKNLFSLVMGECPSLLDETRGGDAELYMLITNHLKTA